MKLGWYLLELHSPTTCQMAGVSVGTRDHGGVNIDVEYRIRIRSTFIRTVAKSPPRFPYFRLPRLKPINCRCHGAHHSLGYYIPRHAQENIDRGWQKSRVRTLLIDSKLHNFNPNVEPKTTPEAAGSMSIREAQTFSIKDTRMRISGRGNSLNLCNCYMEWEGGGS